MSTKLILPGLDPTSALFQRFIEEGSRFLLRNRGIGTAMNTLIGVEQTNCHRILWNTLQLFLQLGVIAFYGIHFNSFCNWVSSVIIKGHPFPTFSCLFPCCTYITVRPCFLCRALDCVPDC